MAMTNYGTILDENFKKLKGFFVNSQKERPKTLFPAYNLFSNLRCNDEENQLEIVIKSDIPADILNKLNGIQLEALEQTLSRKASVCQTSLRTHISLGLIWCD